jgi:peroxiredoxin
MTKGKMVGICVAAALVSAAAATALEIGDKAPMSSVKMRNVDGRELSLAESAGPKGLLVVFTCNHCPWARAWEERIVALGNAGRGQGIGVLAVNSNDTAGYPEDGYEQMQARAKEKGYEFPYVVDATSGVARAFGATRTPEAYLFDAQGRLVYTGAIDDNAKDPDAVKAHYLKDALDAIAGARPVALAKTKALGCSIKLRDVS